MNYRHPRHRIQEIVQGPKCVSEGHSLDVKHNGEHSARFDVDIDLTDGPYCDLRYVGSAGQVDKIETYHTNLILDAQRVRGIGYCPIGRDNFRAKLRIPKGWHQNICDPNMPTDHPDWNRHEALPDFAPTDFSDFIKKSATLWNVDLGWENELL